MPKAKATRMFAECISTVCGLMDRVMKKSRLKATEMCMSERDWTGMCMLEKDWIV